MTTTTNIVGDSACPACKSVGKDSKGNHLIHFKDGSKCCNKCGYMVDTHGIVKRQGVYSYGGVYNATPWEKEYSKSYVHVSSDNPSTYKSLPDRGIQLSTREKYGVVSSVKEEDGSLEAHFYPVYVDSVLYTWKKRLLPKTFAMMKHLGGKTPDLFGQHLFPPGSSKKLVITEGEEDAMATYDMIQASKFGHAVVSLPNGANQKSFLEHLSYIQSFKEVILCLDQDKAGKECLDEISEVLPGVLFMSYKKKDPCEMLKEGLQIEFSYAFLGASRYVPKTIISASEVKIEASKPILMGLSYPYPSLTKATYGLRTPQVIGIGAGPGSGKTTFIQNIQLHLIYEHKMKVAILALEEQPHYSLRKLAGGIMKQPIHLPDCIYSQPKLDSILDDLEGKVFFFKHHKDYGFKEIEKSIRYLALSEGVKFFFIDPISALVAHLDSGETNTYLNNAMLTLEELSNSLGVTVIYVSHLNSPVNSTKDHGEGAKVRAGQFSGSRAMWKFSTDLIGLERNQLADDPEEKNTVNVVILKQRLSGDTCSFKLKYNPATGCLEENACHF